MSESRQIARELVRLLRKGRAPGAWAGTRRAAVDLAGLCLLVLALGAHAGLGGAPAAELPGEFELKAAFVINFIRLVNWAGIPGEGSSSELPVCAVGNSEFASAVRQAAAGKAVGTRALSFKIVSEPDPTHCRVLVLDAAQYGGARHAIEAVRDAPVLTIGNGAGFLALGGMFELEVQDRKVQFDASQEAVRRARLDVSARLLQLSRNLRKGGGGGI